MYFEGKCTARQFPTRLRDCLIANDPTSGQPLWDMVSSNVGTANTDDGYVFRNRTGNPMVLGIKSEVNGFGVDSTNWHRGYRIFVGTSYVPGAAGTNGVINDYLHETTPFFFTPSGYTVDTLPVHYFISVKSDHVIIGYKADLLHPNTRPNVIYLGRPAAAFDPNDNGFVLASGMGFDYNVSSSCQMAGFASSNISTCTMDLVSDPPSSNKVWGKKVFPSTIMVHNNTGGFRGMLDVYILKQDGTLRSLDTIRIGSLDYTAIEVPGMQTMDNTGWWYQNGFTPSTSGSYLLLIPKN